MAPNKKLLLYYQAAFKLVSVVQVIVIGCDQLHHFSFLYLGTSTTINGQIACIAGIWGGGRESEKVGGWSELLRQKFNWMPQAPEIANEH